MSSTLTKEQEDKLASIRKAFHGKAFVVVGGAITVEAIRSQPLTTGPSSSSVSNRRTKMLEQLELAQTLRHKLEAAAANAKTCTSAVQVRHRIVHQSSTVRQLVELTQAVNNPEDSSNHPHYQRLNDMTNMARRKRNEDLERAQAVLKDSNRRMMSPWITWPQLTAPVPAEPSPKIVALEGDSYSSEEEDDESDKDYPSAHSAKSAAPKASQPTEEHIPAWASGAEALPEPDEEEEANDGSIPAWAQGGHDLPEMELPDAETPGSTLARSHATAVTRRRPREESSTLDLRSQVLKMQEKLARNRREKKKKKKKKSAKRHKYENEHEDDSDDDDEYHPLPEEIHADDDVIDEEGTDEDHDDRQYLPVEIHTKRPSLQNDNTDWTPRSRKRKTKSSKSKKRSKREASAAAFMAESVADHDSCNDSFPKRKRSRPRNVLAQREASTSISVTSSLNTESIAPDGVGSYHDGHRNGAGGISQRHHRTPARRKCHSCKSYHVDGLKCQFFLLTGNKCGKTFCMECVTRDYADGFDPSKIHEWHCPSCLGSCNCDSCVGKRTREEKRSINLHENRRSSARRPRS